jgi:hypothetical protein
MRNGVVQSIASNGSVKVAFPAIPPSEGPPPVEGQDACVLIYTGCDDDQLGIFKHADLAGRVVDCSGTAPSAGVVTSHR